MSGLQNFLTPFSHLVFGNRDKVIVGLAGVLLLVTIQLLVTRWRNERLHRDLAAAKSASSSSGGGRRYATNAPVVEEAPVDAGGLPPVKGGRTYARNLGTALQKAGMGPQIYSPPSPPGWAPNTTPPQPSPNMGQPPYAPQNVPWAAPASPQGSPWGGYPSGPGRGMPAPSPSPVPFYQPQPGPQPPMSQPIAPPPGVPGPFAPPVGSPFAPPAFAPAMSESAEPPSFAPQATPPVPVAPPGFAGSAPAAEPPAAEPPAENAGRRGKPKRRRFNFNVLENLEKMVQAKMAEPAPITGWTPPAAAPTTSWTPPVAAPAETGPTLPALTPTLEAESLPLHFGPPSESESAEPEPTEPEPATVQHEPEPEPERRPEPIVASEAEAPVVEPEAQPEPEPEPRREARGSMRSMLFGEEPVSAPEPEPAQAEVEPEPVAAEQPWEEPATTPVPVTPTTKADAWRPWNAAPEPEPEAKPEPQFEAVATTAPDEGPSAEVPETPAAGEHGPNAGTVVIIEDDPAAANYYATLFRGNGYEVQVANDGVSGVDLCTKVQPQVILLDVMMPRQNGILVLQTLRASDETKNTPVVVMSNFSEPTLIKRAIQLGALEYVIKTQVEGPALLNALPRWMNHEKAFAAA
ncbi:MAG: response regulator [Candidatus Dormibacteraeota bacterium]|nr:response regulator [Candidatus Dormibacteraeota bacterium]